MKKYTLLLLTSFLCGCSILGPEEPLSLYTLKSESIEPSTLLSSTIAVDVPLSEASLNTERIAITPTPYQREYLADGQWPDRLPKVVQEVLIDSLTQRWGGVSVARMGTGLPSKYVLQSDILDFSVFQLEKERPTVQLKIMLKLVDLRNRTVIGAQIFEEKTCVSNASLKGIVEGFNNSLHALIQKSIPWMEGVFLKERSLDTRNDKLGGESR